MKSSGTVFTKQNPFTPASTVRRAHYHPSRKQSLSKKAKKTTLSPGRSHQSSSHQLLSAHQETKQLDENCDDGFSVADGHVFSEIWPSVDRGSSPDSNTASPDTLMCKPSQSETLPSGAQDESVLAKYVERFRRGRPRSREERQQMASASREEQMPFWWLLHSTVPSSTPTKAVDKGYYAHEFGSIFVMKLSVPFCLIPGHILLLKDGNDPTNYSPAGQLQHDRSLGVLSDSSQSEFDDTEILHLQERASSLLLRGDCTHSDGSFPVSSDGLGCSDLSSPVTIDEPVRRPLIPTMIKPTSDVNSNLVRGSSSQKTVIPALAPSTRPEEDILFQWRLRRKMEQAREFSQSVQHSSYHDLAFSWQTPGLIHPSTSRQPHNQQQSSHPPQFPQRDAHPHITTPQPETRESHRPSDPSPGPPVFPPIVVSGSPVSQTQSLAPVPAHMHLLCDVLPCPIQSSHAKEKQSISERLDQPQTKVVHKKTQTPEDSSGIISGKHMNSSHAAFGTVEAEVHGHQKVPEKNRKKNFESGKKTALSTKQHRKSPRTTSHQNPPKKATSLKEQHQQKGSHRFSTEHEPPPSPVHSALGQVVSELLFPASVSSPPQKVPASPVSLHTASSSSQPPLPSHNSLEVISQLLQEAEDSDEKEFEDDPLLQVLRQQRKWVKDQISAVDVILNEFLEE